MWEMGLFVAKSVQAKCVENTQQQFGGSWSKVRKCFANKK